jgi:hypothetical protein
MENAASAAVSPVSRIAACSTTMRLSMLSITSRPATWTDTMATQGPTHISHSADRRQGAGRRPTVEQSAAKRAISRFVSTVRRSMAADCTLS